MGAFELGIMIITFHRLRPWVVIPVWWWLAAVDPAKVYTLKVAPRQYAPYNCALDPRTFFFCSIHARRKQESYSRCLQCQWKTLSVIMIITGTDHAECIKTLSGLRLIGQTETVAGPYASRRRWIMLRHPF